MRSWWHGACLQRPDSNPVSLAAETADEADAWLSLLLCACVPTTWPGTSELLRRVRCGPPVRRGVPNRACPTLCGLLPVPGGSGFNSKPQPLLVSRIPPEEFKSATGPMPSLPQLKSASALVSLVGVLPLML